MKQRFEKNENRFHFNSNRILIEQWKIVFSHSFDLNAIIVDNLDAKRCWLEGEKDRWTLSINFDWKNQFLAREFHSNWLIVSWKISMKLSTSQVHNRCRAFHFVSCFFNGNNLFIFFRRNEWKSVGGTIWIIKVCVVTQLDISVVLPSKLKLFDSSNKSQSEF